MPRKRLMKSTARSARILIGRRTGVFSARRWTNGEAARMSRASVWRIAEGADESVCSPPRIERRGSILRTGVDIRIPAVPTVGEFSGGSPTSPAMLAAAQRMSDDDAIPLEGSPMNPAAFPELRVDGPRPDAEALRSAYLDLLAL